MIRLDKTKELYLYSHSWLSKTAKPNPKAVDRRRVNETVGTQCQRLQ